MKCNIDFDKKLVTLYKSVNLYELFKSIYDEDPNWGDYEIVAYSPPKTHLTTT